MTFNEIHEAGAEQFDVLWLLANRAATDTLAMYGVEVHKEPMKSAISEAVLRILQVAAPAPV